MNNSRDKFEAWAKPYYKEQQMSLNSAEHFARPNEYMMPHYQSAYEGWQAATEQSQKEIAALKEREKELVEALSWCAGVYDRKDVREAIVSYRGSSGIFDGYLGAIKRTCNQALANVRGEVK